MGWIEQAHPIWGEGGREEGIHSILGVKSTFPKKQWRSGKYSIVEPSDISFGLYELYPVNGDDVARFDTLEEAQDFAEKDLKTN